MELAGRITGRVTELADEVELLRKQVADAEHELERLEIAGQYNPQLRQMILAAEQTDPDAPLFGGINAVKSSQNLLTWDHPAIDWVRARITDAVTVLTARSWARRPARSPAVSRPKPGPSSGAGPRKRDGRHRRMGES